MSVTINFRVDVRPYSGFEDPSLPIGAYIGQGGVVGNASGGQVLFGFHFQLAEGDPRVTELYNLEQLAIDHTGGSSDSITMQTLNLDALSPARQASPQIWGVGLRAGPSFSALGDDLPRLPLWLGSPNENAASGSALLRIEFTNVNLRLYAATIQGYIWGPRSILAPGGPQRPPNPLW